MINANELRIGNWVCWPDEKEPNKVQWERGHWLGIVEKNYGMPDPILLTPEILLACGFEEQDGEFTHPDNTDFDLMICCSPNNLWCAYNYGNAGESPLPHDIPNEPVANPICNPFKYLHQLQNLYFALTGQELIYKP